MTTEGWRVRLSGPAQADIREIYRWTVGRFGVAQADVYLDVLNAALDELYGGPAVLGARERHDIAAGLYSLHVARNRNRGRHIILFRVEWDGGGPLIVVGRILHESMDIARHFPTDEPNQGR